MPSEQNEIEIECPLCSGDGCEDCGGSGQMPLDVCPRQYVQDIAYEANICSIAINNGVLPVAGGSLDQSGWFVDAWMCLHRDQKTIENERLKRG